VNDRKAKTWIKICGITSAEDARMAAAAGADAVGLVFAESKRRVSLNDARAIVRMLPEGIEAVGVFVDEDPETVRDLAADLGLDGVQLHGSESPGECERLPLKTIKRFPVLPSDSRDSLRRRMEPYRVFARLLDPGAGDGVSFDWSLAKGHSGRLIVAGGLTPDNVASVVRMLHPFGVDVSSGVESGPGKKDPVKMHRFIEEVRCAVRSAP